VALVHYGATELFRSVVLTRLACYDRKAEADVMTAKLVCVRTLERARGAGNKGTNNQKCKPSIEGYTAVNCTADGRVNFWEFSISIPHRSRPAVVVVVVVGVGCS
jgi:hypothetical protein